jgi:hypothetical protein
MPVGAGGEALGRIEAALAADDPALVDSFHRWCEPPGTDPADRGVSRVDRRIGLALLLGLVAVAVGPAGTVAMMLVGGTLVFYLVVARRLCQDQTSSPAG